MSVFYQLDQLDIDLSFSLAKQRNDNKDMVGNNKPLFSGEDSVRVAQRAIMGELAIARYYGADIGPITEIHGGGDRCDLFILGKPVEVKCAHNNCTRRPLLRR